MRQDEGIVMDGAMMNGVVVPSNVVGRLLDVTVLRGESEGMCDH